VLEKFHERLVILLNILGISIIARAKMLLLDGHILVRYKKMWLPPNPHQLMALAKWRTSARPTVRGVGSCLAQYGSL